MANIFLHSKMTFSVVVLSAPEIKWIKQWISLRTFTKDHFSFVYRNNLHTSRSFSSYMATFQISQTHIHTHTQERVNLLEFVYNFTYVLANFHVYLQFGIFPSCSCNFRSLSLSSMCQYDVVPVYIWVLYKRHFRLLYFCYSWNWTRSQLTKLTIELVYKLEC